MENTFEEIYCGKYLRAILLITYLFLYGYDCTDSTLTNMTEWIHEETKVMCYIPHQKSEVLLLFRKALCISGTFLWYQGLVQRDETEITLHLWERKILSSFTKIGFDLCQYQRQCFLTVCLSVTQQSTELICRTAVFIKTHSLVIQSL